MAETTDTDATGPVRFMAQLIGLDYTLRTNPVAQAFDDTLADGRITGHRCPRCGLVFVPPKGFCSICVIATRSRSFAV